MNEGGSQKTGGSLDREVSELERLSLGVANFHFLRTSQELPKTKQCTLITLSNINNDFEAQRYALQFPDRQIYWVWNLNMAVWYIPME